MVTARAECAEIRCFLAGQDTGVLIWLYLLGSPRMRRLVREERKRRGDDAR